MPGNLATQLSAKMGNVGAKIKCGAKVKPRKKEKTTEEFDQNGENKVEEFTKIVEKDTMRDEIWTLKKLIKEKPNVFILNNLLLSVQFFSHYKHEMDKARTELKKREEELNEKLIPEKTVLIPDILREHFTGKLRFTSFCKSDKDEQTVEPLRPIKIYMVYENIHVTELDESRHYSNPGELVVDYTFVLREAEHKGYVRLEKLKKPMLKGGPGSDKSDLSSIAENEDVIYSEAESLYGPIHVKVKNHSTIATTSMPDLLDEEQYYEEQKSNSTQDLQCNGLSTNGKLARASRLHRNLRFCTSNATNPSSISSSSSGYTTNYGLDSDSDSSGLSATQIRDYRRPSGRFENSSEIPSLCFKRVTYMYNGRIYNPRKELLPRTVQQKRIREAKLAHNYDVVYVNGYRFARHFFKVFKEHLAEKMDFDEQVIKNARKCDATIRLEKIDYLSTKKYISIEQYEVIPCLSSPWPKWSRKWQDRLRKDWPSYEDVRKIDKFGCYLVPESLRPTSVDAELNNPLWKLDWNICFPAAERHLESCLSATQMNVYTIALMLHKTFLRTGGTTFGLDTSHIRNMMFWMVERKPDWSEYEMGKSIISLLNLLHNQIQQRKMFDYFMDDRNLFANVHTDDLLHSQKQLKRIIENPVMFVFHAMEKIDYESDDYPRLDYRELLRLLTINELLLINPVLHAKVQEDTEENSSAAYGKRDSEKKFWNEAKQTNQYYMQARRRSMSTLINPKKVFDSIIDIQEKCEPLTPTRLTKLLLFFTHHFMKMARQCHKYLVVGQRNLYLKQAKLLALLLAEDEDYNVIARNMLEEIQQLSNDILSTPPVVQTKEAPETPKRNVDKPIYSTNLKNRYDRFQTVHEECEAGPSNVKINGVKSIPLKKSTSNNQEASNTAEITSF